MFETKKQLVQIYEQIQARQQHHIALRDQIRDGLNHMQDATPGQKAAELRRLVQQVLILNELNLILSYFSAHTNTR